MYGINNPPEKDIMKTLSSIAALGALSLTLAACDSADTAAGEDVTETVEAPAEEALETVTEEPVEDDAAALEEVEGPPAVSEETASAAAENAEAVAKEAEAAAAEAEAAANAAQEAANTADSALDAIEDLEDVIDG